MKLATKQQKQLLNLLIKYISTHITRDAKLISSNGYVHNLTGLCSLYLYLRVFEITKFGTLDTNTMDVFMDMLYMYMPENSPRGGHWFNKYDFRIRLIFLRYVRLLLFFNIVIRFNPNLYYRITRTTPNDNYKHDIT